MIIIYLPHELKPDAREKPIGDLTLDDLLPDLEADTTILTLGYRYLITGNRYVGTVRDLGRIGMWELLASEERD